MSGPHLPSERTRRGGPLVVSFRRKYAGSMMRFVGCDYEFVMMKVVQIGVRVERRGGFATCAQSRCRSSYYVEGL